MSNFLYIKWNLATFPDDYTNTDFWIIVCHTNTVDEIYAYCNFVGDGELANSGLDMEVRFALVSVTNIFLMKNFATPTRAVALRLSIPHARRAGALLIAHKIKTPEGR